MSSGGKYNPNNRDGKPYYNNRQKSGEQPMKKQSATNDPFVLSENPSSFESYTWITREQIWAGVNCARHNHQRMLSAEGGDAPELEEIPEKPLKSDYTNDAEFTADFKEYSVKEARAYLTNKEIKEDNLKLFGHMIMHLSEEFKINIKALHGAGIIDNQDPKALIDAIRTQFLGMSKDNAKNKLNIALQEKKLWQIEQKPTMSLAKYREYYNISIRNLALVKFHAQREKPNAKPYEKIMESMLSEETLVNIFMLGLNKKVWKPWFVDHQKGHEKWPKSVDAAYEKLSQLEKVYLDDDREKKYLSNDSIPVMAAKQAKAWKKPASTKAAKPAKELDSAGKEICIFEKRYGPGGCNRGSSCSFSHNISRNDEKTKGNKPTGPKERDPHCGGGPAPGKG